MKKAEIIIQCCLKGRPIWLKSKAIKKDLSIKMTDKEYAQIVNATIDALNVQTAFFKQNKK